MADFEAVHDRLRDILLRQGGDLALTKDGPAGVAIELPGLEGKPWGYVAGTRVGKSYVSYYLMPVYATPGLADSLSPELRKRMQGKACFNFKSVDDRLFAELEALTARSIQGYRAVAEQNAAQRSR
jgi:hypothetical protein